jgi:hypothetical protein
MEVVFMRRLIKHAIRILLYIDGIFWIPLSCHTRMDGTDKTTLAIMKTPRYIISFALPSVNNPFKKYFKISMNRETSNRMEKTINIMNLSMDKEVLIISQYLPANNVIKPYTKAKAFNFLITISSR